MDLMLFISVLQLSALIVGCIHLICNNKED